MLQISVGGSLEPELKCDAFSLANQQRLFLDIFLIHHRQLAEQAISDLVSRHLAFSTSRLFKLLEVISVLNGDLVRCSLPKIRDQVCITEAKRGTGQDTILRLEFHFVAPFYNC